MGGYKHSPKTNIAPENGWVEVEDDELSFWGKRPMSGAFAVSFRECNVFFQIAADFDRKLGLFSGFPWIQRGRKLAPLYWDVLLVLDVNGLCHPYISRLDTSCNWVKYTNLLTSY